MIFKSTPQKAWRTLALVLAATPWVAAAQTVAPPAPQDWRSANDAVGALKRGHIDVLKWEAANAPQEVAAPAAAPDTLQLLTLDAVIRQAWRAHRDLTHPLDQLGSNNVSLLATGAWIGFDPGLQRRVDDVGDVLEVATQARKAWLQAVAARQALAPYRAALDSIDAATELGQRMVQVGNWSKLKLAPLQIAQSTAKMNLLKAHYAANQAQASLINTLQLKGQYSAVALPERLPEVPPKARGNRRVAGAGVAHSRTVAGCRQPTQPCQHRHGPGGVPDQPRPVSGKPRRDESS